MQLYVGGKGMAAGPLMWRRRRRREAGLGADLADFICRYDRERERGSVLREEGMRGELAGALGARRGA